MSKCSLMLLAICAVQLAAGECPRWISVMPLNEEWADELAEDCADLGNTTFIDGIAWMCKVNPSGDPVSNPAGIYASAWRKVAPLLKAKSSVKQGVLLQATMGHGGFPGKVTPWQLAVKSDGTSVYRMCPMDERFLKYIAAQCRTFAELKPDFFMIDDDTRLVWNRIPGCFCPLHLAEFSRRTGRTWTREQVFEMLKKGKSSDSEAWEEVKADSLRRFFRVIRESFPPEIPGMLCSNQSPQHQRNMVEFARIIASPGQTPIIRGGGAPYGSHDPYHVANMRGYYASQRNIAGDGVIYMQECDTCPHTIWAAGAVRTFDHLVMIALDGCKGAKIWITRIAAYNEKKSANAYRRIFRENKGLIEWAGRVDFRQKGLVMPPCGPTALNFGDRYFALVGVPYRFGKAGKDEAVALTADTLALLKPQEIREILSGAVLCDGSAALWLSENGYSDLVGVEAKAWTGSTIQMHEFSDGTKAAGMRNGELVDISRIAQGAKVLTKLFNIPVPEADAVYVAPGSVLFRNALGGRVLSMAQIAQQQITAYYAATLFTEGYREEVVKWLGVLGCRLPVRYLGVGPVTCLAGTTDEDGDVFVLNGLDFDSDDAPEMAFETMPDAIERLQGDGTWKQVRFSRTASGSVRIESPFLPQHPAIFRWRRSR